MRDRLALEHAAADLVDLALGMGHVPIQWLQPHRGDQAVDLKAGSGVVGAQKIAFGHRQVGAVRLFDLGAFRLTLVLVLGSGVAQPLDQAIEFLELPNVVDALAPVAQAVGPSEIRAGLDGLADGVEQQVGVGRKMYVGLQHEGVTTGVQPVFRAFFYQCLPGVYHLAADPIENLRGEQPQVVLERLQLVGALVRPVAVAEHLADGVVLVGQLMDAVVVGVEPQAQRPQDQDLPLLHPGAPGIRARLAFHALRDHLFEDGEHRLA